MSDILASTALLGENVYDIPAKHERGEMDEGGRRRKGEKSMAPFI